MEKSLIGEAYKLGILGGGQLGRMFIQEAMNYNVHVHILEKDNNAPCANISNSFTKGDIRDFDTVYSFGKDKDLVTVEIENVNIEALYKLETEGVKVFPQPRVLELIKDKGTQKQFYDQNNIPTAPFKLLPEGDHKKTLRNEIPFVHKLRTGGYDGKGVQVITNEEKLEQSFTAPSLVEQMIPFEKELSVIVARNENGQIINYPVVECEFNDANLVEYLFSPADISMEIEEKAVKIALDVINKIDMVGILAVELFLTKDGDILVNEIAPRPHNSGHHTIECNVTSQFEQHMRSILNLPLGSTRVVQAGAMLNLTGEDGYTGPAKYENIKKVMAVDGAHLHLYGKEFTKPNRKMGHLTITSDNISDVKEKVNQLRGVIKVKA